MDKLDNIFAELSQTGFGPQTDKEVKELMAKCGSFFVTDSDETDPFIEKLGLPTFRIANVPGVVPLDLNILNNMTAEARGAMHGQSYGVGPDGSLTKLRRRGEDGFDVRATYARVFPRDLSLEECSQRGNISFTDDFPDCIEFFASRPFTTAGILKAATSGAASIQSTDVPLYHSHVLCDYRPTIRFVANEKFEIVLKHYGPHLSTLTSFPKDYVYPTIRAVHLAMDFNGARIRTEILPERDGKNSLVFNKQFSLADLKKHPNDKIVMHLRLYVPRSNFDLASIIDLDALPPTVSDETARVVATILSGEKPPGADWEITVVEVSEGGDVPMRTFHVHKAAFSSISNRLKTAFREGCSAADDSIGVFAGKQRCSFPRLSAKDMQVVIPLAYGLIVPLPTSGVPYLVESIRRIFNEDYVKDTLAPQWERLICKEALTFDTKKVSSFPSVFRLLSIVWSFPRGWMPVAKRVAIGALADIVHLNAGDEVDKFAENQYAEIRATAIHSDDTEKWNEIMHSMNKHLYMVSSVLKHGPKQEKEPEVLKDEEVKTVEEPEVLNDEEVKTLDSVVVNDDQEESDDVEDDEGWHDEEIHGGFNPADVKCKCVIS